MSADDATVKNEVDLMRVRFLSVALCALWLFVSPAFAHVGPEQHTTFSTGFFHPLGGIDHVLAMVAVGLYAASLGGSAIWLVPAAFIATMVMGGTLGYAGLPLPYVEQAIGLSVVVMGVAITLGVKLPTAIAMTLVALFALFHGHAHGSEGAEHAAFMPYVGGFVVATALLHMAGIGLALGFDRFGHLAAERMMRTTGAVGAAAGISLLAGWLVV